MKMLNVGQLKKALESLPDDMVVVLGDDEEMNGVHYAFFVQTEDLSDNSNGMVDFVSNNIDTNLIENKTVLLIS